VSWSDAAVEVPVGDLTLRPTPVLVAGRITGGDAWERVHTEVRELGEARGRPELPSPVSLSRGDGRYEVRGFASQVEHVLRVRCEGYVTQTLPFVPGTQDFDVELFAAAEVRVDVRYAMDADPSSFGLHLVPDGAASARMASAGVDERRLVTRLLAREAGAGYALWQDVVPGTYRLDCFAIGCSRPLLQIAGIEVRPGRSQDPRLQEVDLRERVRPITLTVTNEQGEGLRGSACVWTARPAAPRDLGPRIQKGLLRLAMPVSEAPADVLVYARGYRAKVVEGVVGDRAVRLERGIEVRFQLPESVRALPARTWLLLHATVDPATTPLGRGGTWAAAGAVPGDVEQAGEDGCFTLRLPAAGRYVLRLELWGGSRLVTVPIEPRSVTVADRDGQSFAIVPSGGGLARALRESGASAR
jgi:hypothetical protein